MLLFFFSNFKNKTANFIYTRITSYICSDVVLCFQRNPLCYITNKLVAVMRFKVILPPKRSGHFISIALIRIKLNVSFDNTKVYLILQSKHKSLGGRVIDNLYFHSWLIGFKSLSRSKLCAWSYRFIYFYIFEDKSDPF